MTKAKPEFHGINLNSLRKSAELLKGHILTTPTIFAPSLSNLLGANLHLKLENLQYTSSFKSRGAFLALKALSNEDKKAGVISMSAGNHAQALAFRAQQENIKSTIIMPEQTPFTKITKTKTYGAEVVLTGRTLDEAMKTVNQLIDANGYRLIHPYDDLNIISGQGTIGLEMMDSNPNLDFLIVPVGGGRANFWY